MSDKVQFRRVMSYVFILAIALVFTLSFGQGSQGFQVGGTAGPASAAVVNGKEIPLRDFNRAYSLQLQYMRAQGGIPESLARQMGLPRQVLEQLVNAELLSQAAERKGIATSDEEVMEVLSKNPDFQKDGRFDLERYREVLRDFYRKTDAEYEVELRRRLSAQKLLDLVESTAVVSEDEVKARFLRESNKADLTFVRFLPTMYASKVPAPKPNELAAFQESSAQEIEAYYNQNKFLYHQPERIQARQILIKYTEGATNEQKAEARQKAENLRKEIEGGKPFAEVATQFSEDVGTKATGGDLGLVERNALEPSLADAAFKAAEGQMTDVIDTRYGVAFVKVEKKLSPATKELKDVSLEIAKQLWNKQKAKELARADAQKALAALKAGKALTALYPAEEGKEPAANRFEMETQPEAVSTGEFSATSDSVPTLGLAPALVKDVFALESPAPLEKLYEVGEGFAVANVKSRTRPDEATFTAQKDTLREEARKAKQIELRETFIKSLKEEAAISLNEELIDPAGGAQS